MLTALLFQRHIKYIQLHLSVCDQHRAVAESEHRRGEAVGRELLTVEDGSLSPRLGARPAQQQNGRCDQDLHRRTNHGEGLPDVDKKLFVRQLAITPPALFHM